MRSSSRFIAPGAVLALVLAACGGDDTGSPPATDDLRPPVSVEVDSVAAPDDAAAASAPTDARAPGAAAESGADDVDTDMIMPFPGGFEYEVGEGLGALPTADIGYEFPAGADVDPDVVTELAAVFGVEGEPVRGGGSDVDGVLWRVGPDDGTAPSLTVNDDSQLTWNYSAAWASTLPAEPAGVPTAEEAEALAIEILSQLDVDPDGLEIDTFADEWSASVTAWPVRDDVRWPLTWGFGFGGGAELQWAGGTLAEPLPTGPYPLVDLDTALARLDDQGRWWGGLSVAATSDLVRESDPGQPSTDVEPSVEPGGAPDGQLDGELPVPEVTVAVLVEVRPDLWWVGDTDGSVWLLPAYTFTDTEGREHTVPAVTDEFVTIADPGPIDALPVQPMPVEPLDPVVVDPGSGDGTPRDPATDGPPDGAVDDAVGVDDAVDLDAIDASSVVGAPTADAEAALEAQGLSMRVIRRDGADLPATMDFIPTRVNVAVEGDVVVELISAG